jgi:hypothetical protein
MMNSKLFNLQPKYNNRYKIPSLGRITGPDPVPGQLVWSVPHGKPMPYVPPTPEEQKQKEIRNKQWESYIKADEVFRNSLDDIRRTWRLQASKGEKVDLNQLYARFTSIKRINEEAVKNTGLDLPHNSYSTPEAYMEDFFRTMSYGPE